MVKNRNKVCAVAIIVVVLLLFGIIMCTGCYTRLNESLVSKDNNPEDEKNMTKMYWSNTPLQRDNRLLWLRYLPFPLRKAFTGLTDHSGFMMSVV